MLSQINPNRCVNGVRLGCHANCSAKRRPVWPMYKEEQNERARDAIYDVYRNICEIDCDRKEAMMDSCKDVASKEIGVGSVARVGRG